MTALQVLKHMLGFKNITRPLKIVTAKNTASTGRADAPFMAALHAEYKNSINFKKFKMYDREKF